MKQNNTLNIIKTWKILDFQNLLINLKFHKWLIINKSINNSSYYKAIIFLLTNYRWKNYKVKKIRVIKAIIKSKKVKKVKKNKKNQKVWKINKVKIWK